MEPPLWYASKFSKSVATMKMGVLVWCSPREQSSLLALPAQMKNTPEGCFSFVRVPGIEPGSRPWQGRILPLNYTRVSATVSFIILHPRTQPNVRRKWVFVLLSQKCKYVAHTTSKNSVPHTDTPCQYAARVETHNINVPSGELP